MKTIFNSIPFCLAIVLMATNVSADFRQQGRVIKPHDTNRFILKVPAGKSTITVQANGNMPISCEFFDMMNEKGNDFSKWKPVLTQTHVPMCVGTVNVIVSTPIFFNVRNDNPIELPYIVRLVMP